MLKGYNGVDLSMLKIYLLLYADDIVLFSESEQDLQFGLNILDEYCEYERWKLTVSTDKTKIMIFRKGGRHNRNIGFTFNGKNIEIISKFKITHRMDGSCENGKTAAALSILNPRHVQCRQ